MSGTRAREMQADTHFDGLVDLEKEILAGSVDPIAARVAIDSRKWRLARMRPKVYGDRIDVTSSDHSMSPKPAMAVDLTHLTATELLELTDKIFDNADESEA